MSNSRTYWNSLEQYNNDPEFVENAQREFAEDLPVDEFLAKEEASQSSTSRRDFLKFVGFSVAAATVAACEAPVTKSIPYVVKPEEIVPGVANYYASTFFDGVDFANVLVKTREGRPIHIEGNKLSPISKGGLHARVNSSVLSLYDSGRLQGPTVKGESANWEKVDSTIASKLDTVRANGGTVRFLTSSYISPSGKKAIGKLKDSLGENADFKSVTYDAYSYAGMRYANEESFGKAMIPQYHFDKAKVIVSFGADFLTNWLSPIEFAKQYSDRRNPSKDWMSRHFQFESNFSVTGTNADVRGAVKSSQLGLSVLALYNELAKKAGAATVSMKKIDDDNNVSDKIKTAANELWSNKGSALVVSGSNDKDTQVVINAINDLLGSYGKTIDPKTEVYLKQSDDKAFVELVNEMKSGSVDLLFVNGVNPVYSAPSSLGFDKALSKVGLTVSFADRLEETASNCTVNATPHHYLESWNDFNPKTGLYSISQPTIRPLFNTRQMEDSMLVWAGEKDTYYDFIRKNWEKDLLPKQSKYSYFDSFWNSAVHDGLIEVAKSAGSDSEESGKASMTFGADVAKSASVVSNAAKSSNWDVELYMETSMGVGNHANNPWLQELPHPVSKVTWDNYIAMNPEDMKDENGNEVYPIKIAEKYPAKTAKITVNGKAVELPVIALPGQRRGAVSIALGYGRTKAGKVILQGDQKAGDQKTIGANVFPFVEVVNGTMQYVASGASIEPTGTEYPIGSTQIHDTMMGRKIVNETSLKTFNKHGKSVWNPDIEIANAYGKKTPVQKLDMWNDHDLKIGHHWGMTIDLNACIGCGACVIGCHSENNVPVVGKDEVRRTRTMSWLRIDRYFSSNMTKPKAKEEGIGKIDMYHKMEVPSDYPEAVYQPVMCQHCNHAPCETVCPVAATTHSNEGLNQMTYNRCIGTRYCANNCPYKVRRFNWFNYKADYKFTGVNPSQDDLGKMVLNPDVTVRSRGVMEKCSFCVQRIQEGKLNAKKEGRPVKDGEVTTACATACPTNAIQFGDLNDDNSQVNEISNSDRSYNLLQEIGTKPNVFYMTKVRNVDEERVSEAVKSHGGSSHGHEGEESHGHGEEEHSGHEA
ncbi:TAT-variant-translocated molybdopterin oxidoreductase [Salibacter halophilus]|uniref:4Fe-4S dicluster domain-containing protein n=1 Tax=Salibacter halophilus TaxID=1803916 RepID=A0A6N6M559_9FLAO|nr:TAT-variant-translocated molybdopterin oxidoreductase [Salibacter halophilus]KAB1063371.1 4Fe-4S dicluster domain-containing protein [Salibacter halophilus]